jgi:hypothetical protein
MSCSVTHRSKQEFDVSIAASDWRLDRFYDTPPERGDKFLNIAADRGVHGPVTHDTFF